MNVAFYLEEEDIKDRGSHTTVGHPAVRITTEEEPQKAAPKVARAVRDALRRLPRGECLEEVGITKVYLNGEDFEVFDEGDHRRETYPIKDLVEFAADRASVLKNWLYTRKGGEKKGIWTLKA